MADQDWGFSSQSDPSQMNAELQAQGIARFGQPSMGESVWNTIASGLTVGRYTVSNAISSTVEGFRNAPELTMQDAFDEQGNPLVGKNPYYWPSPTLDPETANKQYGVKVGNKDLDLSFSEPIAEDKARALHDRRIKEINRQTIIQQGPQGFWADAASFAGHLVSGIAGPENALFFFAPGFGKAAEAGLLYMAGEGTIGSMAVKGLIGATKGVQGMVAMQPLSYFNSQAELRDFSMATAMHDILIGGAIGGGLHMVGDAFTIGAAGYRSLRGITKAIDEAPAATKQSMLNEAVTAFAENRTPRADLYFMRELASGTDNMSSLAMVRAEVEEALAKMRSSGDRRADARAGNVLSTEARAARSTDPLSRDPYAPIIIEGEQFGPPLMITRETGSSIPLLARDGNAMVFEGQTTATNAAKRIQREQGIKPDVVETPDGKFTLRQESAVEPVRNTDGTVMGFANERQAKRYASDIMKDTDLAPMKFSENGQPVRFALVRGATESELAAAAKSPHMVELRPTENIEVAMQRRAMEVDEAKERILAEADKWFNEMRNPQPRYSPAEVKARTDIDTRAARAKSEQDSITTTGGKTEVSILKTQNDEMAQHIDQIKQLGELPPEAEPKLAAALEQRKEAAADAKALERFAACLEGAR